MATIVWGACTAHTAAMNRRPPGTDPAQADRVFAAFQHLHDTLIASKPDALVVVGTDHFMTFNYDAVPTFAIGTGDSFQSWGEGNSPNRRFRGHDALSIELVEGLVAADFDVLRVDEMRVDHAFATPLGFLLGDTELPVIPIYVNCTVTPLPSHARCRAFGQALGKVLRAQAAAPRVAVVGTGGLSHWIGVPRTGDINESFDHDFLDRFVVGDLSGLVALDSDRVIEEAGNGAAEIRNWIIASEAICPQRRTQLAYEPVRSWKTGIGLVELTP
jgi:aromatic ring-opening dioxygenase catalytic subunit (LigB family)